MSKAVLISINKPHTDNIFSYDKNLEWRKKPLPEGLCYVYETKNKGGCGMVIGEMRIVGSVAVDTGRPLPVGLVNAGCVHPTALKEYANNGTVYANLIQDARRYDKPKPLSVFYKVCAGLDNTGMCWDCEKANGEECDCVVNGRLYLTRPPQSWCHVEKLEDGKRKTAD